MMQTKTLTVEKMDAAGTGLARIAQLSEIDKDGDTYAPGAFAWGEGGGQWCQILPAHNKQAMPLGKAWVYEKDGWALADFTLNLETQAGSEWHKTLKFDLDKGKPVQEWSYGFDTLDADFEQRDGDRVRVLKRLDVHEISPVLVGAGVGTGTLAIKGAALKTDAFAALVGELGAIEAALADDPARLSASGLKQLADIHDAIGGVLKKAATEETVPDDTALALYLKMLARKHMPVAAD